MYTVFDGRATRKEYWMYVFYTLIIYYLMVFIDFTAGTRILHLLYALAVFIPGIAITTRRLHDTGRSGYWQFIQLIPLFGTLYLAYLLTGETKSTENQFIQNSTNEMVV